VRLLLFDIDGTLIRGNQAGRLALGATLQQMFGTMGSLDAYQFGGKTDKRIITELLTEAGIPPEEVEARLPELFDLMAVLAEEIYPKRGITPCPGVQSLLAVLRERDDVVLGLLTGNARATARLKLSAAGIDPDQFLLGAFGSDDLDRNSLPAIAMWRAGELTGETFTGANTVIIGDTPADVECARAGKAMAVAVASGWHSADTLMKWRPDHLFTDLGDTEAALRVLLDDRGAQNE
jgi:phosphoglycolate phosphatase-like HAD superfamily hydrolase